MQRYIAEARRVAAAFARAIFVEALYEGSAARLKSVPGRISALVRWIKSTGASRAAPIARNLLFYFPIAAWYLIFPLVATAVAVSFFLVNDQGMELLKAIATAGQQDGDLPVHYGVLLILALIVLVFSARFGVYMGLQALSLEGFRDGERIRDVGRRLGWAMACILCLSVAFAWGLAKGWIGNRAGYPSLHWILLLMVLCAYFRFAFKGDQAAATRLLMVYEVLWLASVVCSSLVEMLDSPDWLTFTAIVLLNPIAYLVTLFPLIYFHKRNKCITGALLAAGAIVYLADSVSLISFLIVALCIAIPWALDSMLRRRREPPGKIALQWHGLPRRTWQIGAVSMVLGLVALLLQQLAPIGFARAFGAPAIVVLVLAAWAYFGTLIFVYLPARLGGVALSPLVILIPLAFSAMNDNHVIRSPDSKDELSIQPRPDAKEFIEWFDRATEGDINRPVFLVSAAGGGLRATHWTSTLLGALDDKTCGEFGQYVYAISGVSGGSLGAVTYAAGRRDLAAQRAGMLESCKAQKKTERDSPLTVRLSAFAGQDYLSPVIAGLLMADTFQAFVPFPIFRDRGSALENAWATAWTGDGVNRTDGATPSSLDEPFLGVRGKPMNGAAGGNWIPHLLLNATRVEDGRRALMTTLKFPMLDAYDVIGDLPMFSRIKTSVATHNSARFTYVSPVALLLDSDGSKWGRVADGGYFENSGAATLTDLIVAIEAEWKLTKRTYMPNLQLIVVTSDPDELQPLCQKKGEAPRQPTTSEKPRAWLAGLLAPVDTILGTRSGRSSLHVRDAIQRLANFKGKEPCDVVIEFSMGAEFKGGGKYKEKVPPLGWFLSSSTQRESIGRATKFAERFRFDYAADCMNKKAPVTFFQMGSYDPCTGTSAFITINPEEKATGSIGTADKLPPAALLKALRTESMTLAVASEPGEPLTSPESLEIFDKLKIPVVEIVVPLRFSEASKQWNVQKTTTDPRLDHFKLGIKRAEWRKQFMAGLAPSPGAEGVKIAVIDAVTLMWGLNVEPPTQPKEVVVLRMTNQGTPEIVARLTPERLKWFENNNKVLSQLNAATR